MRSIVLNAAMATGLSWPTLAIAQGQPHAEHGSASAETIAPGGKVSGLTLADLEQMSLERNPTLVQAGAQVRMSQGNALQAGLYPNPTVGYAADQIGAEGTVGEFQGMFVEQEFVTGGKLAL